MSGGRILILGAGGRIGRPAAEAFRDDGWQVVSLVRSSSIANAAPGTEIAEADARDAASLADAARGANVILHALNPTYVDWEKLVLPFADAAIAAARASGATLVLPGNVYNYGADMPELLDENTPMRPTSRKGALRVEIENRMQAASADGVRCIVLRAGDFYGGDATGSWFDRVITRYALQGRLTYPGPLDVVHTWAYLPDLVAALVRLVNARASLAPFETFGFPGHAVTGRQFLGTIQRATGRLLKVSDMPWWFLRLLSPLVPTFRELTEIAYLWQVPHWIDGSKLQAAIGEIPATPLEDAIKRALQELGLLRA
jgi:nucleoside-diphosphate-sugar epimerase